VEIVKALLLIWTFTYAYDTSVGSLDTEFKTKELPSMEICKAAGEGIATGREGWQELRLELSPRIYTIIRTKCIPVPSVTKG